MSFRCAIVLASCTALLPAQGLLSTLLKPSSPAPANAAPKVDVGAALQSGAILITFVTIATDQGMKAVDTMIDMYPPEKVAKIRMLSAQYKEATAKRKDGNIDSEQLKMATEAGDELAVLQNDWQCYSKEKAASVSKAHSHLGLMLGADAIALLSVPQTLSTLQAACQSLANNPLQLGKAAQVFGQVTLLGAVIKQIPLQTKSFQTVRGMVSNIAKAENITLAADIPADQVKDIPTLTKATKELDS
jgi:hypothetical protein